jgi:hypothetical protein
MRPSKDKLPLIPLKVEDESYTPEGLSSDCFPFSFPFSSSFHGNRIGYSNAICPFIDKNSLWGELNIRKTELNVKQSRPKDMKEVFKPVLVTTIIK